MAELDRYRDWQGPMAVPCLGTMPGPLPASDTDSKLQLLPGLGARGLKLPEHLYRKPRAHVHIDFLSGSAITTTATVKSVRGSKPPILITL
eukprot:1302866-Rhodomonas_salina.1